jgi:AraC-like DNA-binding protein
MHAFYLSTVADLLEAQGVSEQQLLSGTGLAALRIPEALSLSADQLDAVCSQAIVLSTDPQFGLQVGSRLNMSSQGIFGYALMTSATVGDALKLLIRYSRTIMPSIQIEIQQDAGRVDVLVEANHLSLDLQRFYCEVLFSAIVVTASILIGDRRAVNRLEFDYGPPENTARYKKFFGTDVHFNSDRCALSFDETGLGIAISTANPVAQDIFRRECDRLSSLDNPQGSVSERVRRLLLKSGSEFPTSAAVAQHLHMSESTLQRRLSKEGCRYQQLLDQVRYRLAREYLSGTNLSLADIANLLGFSDSANLRRSFKRWSGTTPSAVRTQGLEARDIATTVIAEHEAG